VLADLVLILASCDVTGAAVGACVNQCPKSTGASYTICADQENSSSFLGPGEADPITTPQPKPKRLCSYYVNGTIDVPTSSIITAWVEVGSRACIGDPEPEDRVAKPESKTVAELITEAFTAHATRPFAFLQSGSEVEITEPVSFAVNLGGGQHSGQLFGESATIRFVPIGVDWFFSDGQRLNGQFVSTSFEEPGDITAVANVSYRIDYQRSGGSWVLGAATASLNSNELSLSVVDPPRRTLLVG
jgi:hypothetical protein